MKIFISAADASGDLHAAALVEALRERVAGLEIIGLGGAELASLGQRAVVPQSELAIGGLVEVLSSLPRAVRAYAQLRGALRREAPEVVVLVDSPDLNLPLAAVAHRLGLPVFYYIAPQVWAWREGRVRKLRRRTDQVGVIFPFEEAFLRKRGVRATFVGHPLVERMARLRQSLRPKTVAEDLGLDRARPVLSLLPGSRRNELAGNLPHMLETAELLHRSDPGLQVLLPLAPSLGELELELPPWVRVLRGQSYPAMALSTCLITAPGTVTVEAALLGIPHVISHRSHSLSFELFRRVSRVRSSAMMNLVADAGIVSERIQGLARPAGVAALAARLLGDAVARQAMRRDLERAVQRLGPANASERAAEHVLELAKGA